MKGPQLAPEDCPLVRALGIIGERWTMLLLRQAFYGISRFDEIQAELGISRKVLADRLARMVQTGLLTRAPYRAEGQRTRHEYTLTTKGRDLATALIALMQWADRNMPHPKGIAVRILDRATSEEARVAVVSQGQEIPLAQVTLEPHYPNP